MIRYKNGWLAVLALALLLSLMGTAAAQDAANCDLDSEEAYNDRAWELRGEEDWEAALADYNCALAINPDNLDSLFGRGYVYLELREYTPAEVDYNRVLELNPTNGPAYNNRGNVYYSRGDYAAAIADYDRAIAEPNSDRYIPYYNRGNAYHELGNYEQALADFAESIDLNPVYPDAFLSRAWVYLSLDDPAAYPDFLEWVELSRRRTIDLTAEEATNGTILGMTEGSVYEVPFEIESGQTIRIAARTEANTEVDPLIVLLDPAGAAVSGDDDSGVNLDAVLRYTAESNGTYTLLVSHAAGGSEGEVNLTLSVSGTSSVSTSGTTDTTEATPEALATPETPEEPSDDTFDTFNLVVNEPAVVFSTEFDRLNLRSGPGLNFEILDKLFRDSVVELLEGPRKFDGYAWWRVRTAEGLEGWAVERVETEQTLQPALVVGQQAVVTTTDGDTLRAREGAGRDFTIVVQIPNGAVVDLLEGPIVADDLSWWRVRTAEGIEGWAVERVGDERTLSKNDGGRG